MCSLVLLLCLLVWFEHIGAQLVLPLLGPLELELVASEVNIRGEFVNKININVCEKLCIPIIIINNAMKN